MPAAVRTAALYVLVLLYLASRCYAHGDSMALSFELNDNEKQCFHQDWQEVKPMTFSFRVLRGGNRDVDVAIESPAARDVYTARRESSGQTQFETGWGSYSFCFSNEFSTVSHKVVYFELRPLDHDSLADEAGRKRPFVDTQVQHSLEEIHTNNENTKKYQTVYKIREAKGRDVADRLNQTVMMWSGLESLIILCLGFGQVWMLKKLFRAKPATYRSKPTPSSSTVQAHAVNLLLANQSANISSML